jgi:hypothetical protein
MAFPLRAAFLRRLQPPAERPPCPPSTSSLLIAPRAAEASDALLPQLHLSPRPLSMAELAQASMAVGPYELCSIPSPSQHPPLGSLEGSSTPAQGFPHGATPVCIPPWRPEKNCRPAPPAPLLSTVQQRSPPVENQPASCLRQAAFVPCT